MANTPPVTVPLSWARTECLPFLYLVGLVLARLFEERLERFRNPHHAYSHRHDQARCETVKRSLKLP
uniref:Transcription factor 24 n=1 Tax=Mus musculus TaxID=10090 RepID=Q3UV43_MOUSE|nr:unnamed protein product [Mus musculus]